MKKKSNKNSYSSFWLYGRHSVEEALKNPYREKIRLVMSKKSSFSQSIQSSIPVVRDDELFTRILPAGVVHQGVALEVKPLTPTNLDDILHIADSQQSCTILILDGVTDVHNIGAILRSCAAFEVLSVIVPENNTPLENATMARAASGALDIVPLVRVTNLSRCISRLKESGFWIIGMDGRAKESINALNLPPKRVLVMGSEGSGMRRLTLESCDFMVKIPMSDKMESLNVSVAAAIALYSLYTNTAT